MKDGNIGGGMVKVTMKAPSGHPPAGRTELTPEEIETLYARLQARLPEPTTELEWRDPFTLLVAVSLSAQATDVSVNKATRTLFPVADTPEKMAALGEEGVAEHIQLINFHRTKARNVVEMSRRLIEEHGGEVPRSHEALVALPGVGPKTAAVVLNTAFGVPVIPVDTHIFRVSNRTGLAPGGTPQKVQAILEEVTPSHFKRYAHHWLLLHGRYICVARRPKCPICPIADICRYPDKTPPAG
jgi:endonuclease-3